MIERIPKRVFGSIWTRLMLSILAVVVCIWIVLAIAIAFFGQVRRDYDELAHDQIPRLALVGEIMEGSAKLARITTTIVAQQSGGNVRVIRQSLADTIKSISDLMKALSLVPGPNLGVGGELTDDVSAKLEEILAIDEKRSQLSAQLAAKMVDLRWLNVDIQDEVEPLLSDFAFNIEIATENLTKSQHLTFRQEQAGRIERERNNRDTIRQIGSEAATLVTLMSQISVATDLAQLDPLRNLSDDALTRLNGWIALLPEKPDHLTLRQSIEALSALARDETGIFHVRQDWTGNQEKLVEALSSVQQKLAQLQGALTAISKSQRERALEATLASASRSQTALWWLVGLTLLTGLLAAVTLFGYIRTGIVRPLGQMSEAMLAIADGGAVPKLPDTGDDEIGRMARAVRTFRASVEARDATLEELHQTQAELIQAGKLAALGQLSSGIGHELNQPLAAMKHRVHLLRKGHDASDDEKVRHQIDRLDGLVERMEATISHLKRYARRAENRSDDLRLGLMIDESVSLLKSRIDGERIKLNVEAELAQTVVVGDQILIEQVIINLISNAIDAIEANGGEGTITLKGSQSGKMFTLSIADDGVGLGDLTPEAAFDPFVTTKEVGQGLGLGLSISYNIAKDMGGHLRLAANPPRGTCALLSVPMGAA